MAAIMAAHGIPYVATASPAYHIDLMNKVRKAAAVPGPAYLHIYAPCPTGWRAKVDSAISSPSWLSTPWVFPLYEVIDGEYVISRKVKKPKPVGRVPEAPAAFRSPQGR